VKKATNSPRTPARLLEMHREGSKLTRGQGIRAKCADCMNAFIDGRQDCGIKACPLYPWRPYKAKAASDG